MPLFRPDHDIDTHLDRMVGYLNHTREHRLPLGFVIDGMERDDLRMGYVLVVRCDMCREWVINHQVSECHLRENRFNNVTEVVREMLEQMAWGCREHAQDCHAHQMAYGQFQGMRRSGRMAYPILTDISEVVGPPPVPIEKTERVLGVRMIRIGGKP